MERFFDIFFSSCAVAVLTPLLVPVVLILRFSGEGEIFFLQERIGKGGKTFNLIKFATMLKDSPNMGTGTVTMRDDLRILPVGRILRKTKINELPQLFNILLGDMSVVGPRPLTAQTFGSYSIQAQAAVKSVLPGLSGIGSVIFRNEEEIMHGTSASVEFYDEVIAPYKGALEEWFVNNKGLRTYFVTIFITAWAVVHPSTTLTWKVFKNLPEPPPQLCVALSYRD